MFGRRTSPPGEPGALSDGSTPRSPHDGVHEVAPSAAPNEVEHRAWPRAPTIKTGTLIMDGAPGGIECTVRDLSIGGAGIHVADKADLPGAMQLLIVADGLLFDCALVWRQDDRAGLRFNSRHDLRNDADGFQAIRALWRQLAARRFRLRAGTADERTSGPRRPARRPG